jgi:hypothetical protein
MATDRLLASGAGMPAGMRCHLGLVRVALERWMLLDGGAVAWNHAQQAGPCCLAPGAVAVSCPTPHTRTYVSEAANEVQ